jgi:hypothetical protein
MSDELEARPFTDDDLYSLVRGPVAGKLKPHPATGWMSVEKIPGSLMLPPEEEEDDDEVLPTITFETPQGTLQAQAVKMQGPRVGIIGAKVVEIGKFPNEQKIEFDWGPGDTIYMASDRGVDIGDYCLVLLDKVIAWVPADESEDE